MKDMTVGIIGGGTVGQATARAYLGHVKDVRVWDTDKARRTHTFAHEILSKSDVTFICLPENEVGVFLHDHCRDSDLNLVIKSTVPIGSTRKFSQEFGIPNLVHSPEFLDSRTATLNAMMPTRNVIGYTRTVGRSNLATGVLATLYQDRFPTSRTHLMSSDESEAVKLFQNAFFATKVALWNEFYCLAERLGLDWDNVRSAILADGRIHPSHTMVPGPDGKRGFGGACLPKDLAALIRCYEDHDLDATVLFAAYTRNKEDRPE